MELRAFRESYSDANAEHAFVMSPNNTLYELRGTSASVNLDIIGHDALRGSIVAHNHPPEGGWGIDSFSQADFVAFFEKDISEMHVYSSDLHNMLAYTGMPITGDEAYDLYEAAVESVRQRAMRTKPISQLQLQTMCEIAKTLRGLIFI